MKHCVRYSGKSRQLEVAGSDHLTILATKLVAVVMDGWQDIDVADTPPPTHTKTHTLVFLFILGRIKKERVNKTFCKEI